MARIGISEQQVIEAAEQLLQMGQAATVSSVREVIGSGSFSTINAWLTKWKESADSRKPADVPEMPETVARGVRHLWASAWNEAQSGIKAEREALEAARREVEREQRAMAAEIARLESENAAQAEDFDRVAAALAEKTVALAEADKTASALRVENARLDERAKAAETRAEELRQELERLHTRFQEMAGAPKAAKDSDGRKKSKPPK